MGQGAKTSRCRFTEIRSSPIQCFRKACILFLLFWTKCFKEVSLIVHSDCHASLKCNLSTATSGFHQCMHLIRSLTKFFVRHCAKPLHHNKTSQSNLHSKLVPSLDKRGGVWGGLVCIISSKVKITCLDHNAKSYRTTLGFRYRDMQSKKRHLISSKTKTAILNTKSARAFISADPAEPEPVLWRKFTWQVDGFRTQVN